MNLRAEGTPDVRQLKTERLYCDLAIVGGGTTKELARFANSVLQRSSCDTTGLDATSPRLRYKSISGHVRSAVDL